MRRMGLEALILGLRTFVLFVVEGIEVDGFGVSDIRAILWKYSLSKVTCVLPGSGGQVPNTQYPKRVWRVS